MVRDNEPMTGQERFQKLYPDAELPGLSPRLKRQHLRDGVFDALRQVAKEGARGQPYMVERFRAVAEKAEELVAQGIPFGTCPNSRMNKEIRKILNHEAKQTSERSSKSRRKQVKGGAVEYWLKKVQVLRTISDHFIHMAPYRD
jgi:hypothetical protein